MAWEPEEVDLLIKLIGEGCSATSCAIEINRTFKKNYSRSAVIGKAHRKGYGFSGTDNSRKGAPRKRALPPPKTTAKKKSISTSKNFDSIYRRPGGILFDPDSIFRY